MVNGKFIFQSSPIKEIASPVLSNPFGGDAGAETSPLSGDVVLVGLLPGNIPQAILEDGKTKHTYYLSKGQSSNGIVLEDIQGNTVTLSIDGERKKLTL